MHGNEVEKVKEKGKPNRRGGDEKTGKLLTYLKQIIYLKINLL